MYALNNDANNISWVQTGEGGPGIVMVAYESDQVDTSFNAEVLVVAGGGGGKGNGGGGGGGGGVVYRSSYPISHSETFTISIGSGGTYNLANNNGGNSEFGHLLAYGGGGGGTQNENGKDGGCGGGGGAFTNNPTTFERGHDNSAGFGNHRSNAHPSFSDLPVQGYRGGYSGGSIFCGGGGGAGGSGGDSSQKGVSGYNPGSSGAGGAGLEYSITGSPVYYSAGGGVNGGSASGVSATATDPGSPGLGTYGYGGKGTCVNGSTGTDGNQGVVIVAYPTAYPAMSIPSNLTYTTPTRSGYRVYQFTGGTGEVSVPQ